MAEAGPKGETYAPDLVTAEEIKALLCGVQAPGNNEEWLIVETFANGMSPLHQPDWNALVLLNPEVKTDALSRDIVLTTGQVRKGTVVGPDGRPLAGVMAAGLTAKVGELETLKTAEFNVKGLQPKRSRNLVFYHKEKDLGGFAVVRGDEKGPLTVQMKPCGGAVGRIVDKAGQPVAGLPLMLQSTAGGLPANVVTDREGRFQVKSLVPGPKYDLFQLKGVSSRLDSVVVEPGKTKEMGDIKAHQD